MEPRISWFASFAILAVLLFPVGGGNMMGEKTRERYKYLREELRVPIMPPGWLFGPIWLLLYGFMTAVIVLWSAKDIVDQAGATWWSVWILFIVNVVVNKAWYPLFFESNKGAGYPKVASVIAVLIFGTALAILVLIWLDSWISQTAKIVSLAFWSAYVLWALFATVLSIWLTVAMGRKAKESGKGNQPLLTPEL